MTPFTERPDPAAARICPTCGSDVLNAQGLYTCSACSWTPTEHR